MIKQPDLYTYLSLGTFFFSHPRNSSKQYFSGKCLKTRLFHTLPGTREQQSAPFSTNKKTHKGKPTNRCTKYIYLLHIQHLKAKIFPKLLVMSAKFNTFCN